MNGLRKTLENVRDIVKGIPNVQDVFIGDIYDNLNANQSVCYPAGVISKGDMRMDFQNKRIYTTLNIFLCDRETDDKSNKLQVQSWAVNVLYHIAKKLNKSKFYIPQETIQVKTFEERFGAVAAGAFMTCEVFTPMNECESLDSEFNIYLDQSSETFDDSYDGKTFNSITINYSMPNVNRSMGLCLPFDLNNAELTELFGEGYGLVTYDTFTMSINPDDTPNIQLGPVVNNTELRAGVPYVVQPRKVVNSIVVYNKKIKTQNNDYVLTNGDYKLTFKGSFVKRTIDAPDKSTHIYNYALSGGMWKHPSTDLPLNGYRTYFRAEENN